MPVWSYCVKAQQLSNKYEPLATHNRLGLKTFIYNQILNGVFLFYIWAKKTSKDYLISKVTKKWKRVLFWTKFLHCGELTCCCLIFVLPIAISIIMIWLIFPVKLWKIGQICFDIRHTDLDWISLLVFLHKIPYRH